MDNSTPRKVYPGNIFDDFFAPSQAIRSDIIEDEKSYIVTMDVPGLSKSDIKIDFQNGYLQVSAENKEAAEETEKNYVRRERYYGAFSRQFYLGNVDADNIKAEYNNGILKITVPKLDESINKKKIDIE